jgi:DNA polymerase-3 subunit gamma/tau
VTHHEALFRKARPRSFDAVVGHPTAVKSITKGILGEHLPSAILLSGHYGCGKTTLARLIAASLNCEYRKEGSADPCGGTNSDCMTCPGVIEGRSGISGLTELDAATNGSIEAVRELIASMDYQIHALNKVYIIDEAHRLSQGAVTALLKTIEEPPPNVTIIMATTEPERIPDPIQSRMTHWSLPSLDNKDIADLLRTTAEAYDITLSESDVTAIISRSNNSGREALNLLEQWSRQEGGGDDDSPLLFLNGMTDAIADSDSAAVITLINERIVSGEDAATCLRALTTHFRNSLIAAQAPEALSVAAEWKKAAEYGADRIGLRTLLSLVNSLISASRTNSPDARLALEAALLDVILRKSKASSAQAAGLSEQDVTTIVDAVADRLAGVVSREVTRALESAGGDHPGSGVTSRGAPTVESALDEAADEVAKPLPEPSDEEDADSAGSVAKFNADEFLEAMGQATSRRGKLMLTRHATLERSDEDDDTLLLVMSQTLSDEDWDAVASVTKGLGWNLEERIKEPANA